MRYFFLTFLTILSSFPAYSQSKHPFTFEDMMALKRVEEPEVSPDGKWVLYAAVDVDLKANTRTPHVWVVSMSTHPGEREIISAQDADRPRWSPDGKHFAFISTKEGGSQVWIADFNDVTGSVTGVRKLTSIATEADGELWSPDGKNILFRSPVYPECTGTPVETEACNKKKLDESAKSKVQAMIFTHLLYRHWNGYKESKRSHLLIASVEGGAARDLTPGDYDAPQFSLGGQDNYAFSPDGKEICYTSNHDEQQATSTNNDLWIVPIDGGTNVPPVEAKNITAENKASDSTPLYSPDGKYIAYRAQQRPGYESDKFRLMLYDRKTGEKKNLTELLDAWATSFTWAPDSSHIYFSAEALGESPILTVSPDHPIARSAMLGNPGRLNSDEIAIVLGYELAPGYNDDLTVTPDGKTIVFTQMSVQHPNEISVAPLDQSSQARVKACIAANKAGARAQCISTRRLTHANDAVLNQVSMYPLEPFWFSGANGDSVEGFIVKPPNFGPGKKYPVKFLIHGGPEGAWADDWSYRWNPEIFAANGYVVIMINFHGSTGYGQKFVDAINGDWGGAPFEDLMKGLDYAEAHYPFIDKDRECALGASYGGYMTNWILGHTDRFKCIVTHDGMFNTESAWGTTEELWFNQWEFKGTPYNNRELYRKWSPHLFATNFNTPTLVVHGQLDYRLDVSEGFQLFTTLQSLGVPSKMLYFPDEGHWVLKPQNSRLWYKTVNDWVDQWVKK